MVLTTHHLLAPRFSWEELWHVMGQLFLGIFAQLQKAIIGFIMFVCPSVHMEQLGSKWKDFQEI